MALGAAPCQITAAPPFGPFVMLLTGNSALHVATGFPWVFRLAAGKLGEASAAFCSSNVGLFLLAPWADAHSYFCLLGWVRLGSFRVDPNPFTWPVGTSVLRLDRHLSLPRLPFTLLRAWAANGVWNRHNVHGLLMARHVLLVTFFVASIGAEVGGLRDGRSLSSAAFPGW